MSCNDIIYDYTEQCFLPKTMRSKYKKGDLIVFETLSLFPKFGSFEIGVYMGPGSVSTGNGWQWFNDPKYLEIISELLEEGFEPDIEP